MPFANLEQRRAYHRAKGRAWVAKERAKRIAAGQCITCRTPVTKFLQCLDCRKARAQDYATRIRPAIQAKAHRCADCQRKCTTVGVRRCGVCTARRANAIRWRRASGEAA